MDRDGPPMGFILSITASLFCLSALAVLHEVIKHACVAAPSQVTIVRLSATFPGLPALVPSCFGAVVSLSWDVKTVAIRLKYSITSSLACAK